MAKKSQQQTTQTLDDNVVATVLAEISEERKQAHADLAAAEKAVIDLVNDINDSGRPVVQALQDAEADLKAHARFEKRMPKAAFDAKNRVLTKAAEEARAAHAKLQRDANERLQAPREAAVQQAESCRELAREWNAHLRLAKASGVDVAAYWTPEAKQA